MACAGYLGYPFQNKRVKSGVENLARHVGKEEKFGMVIIISAFYGTDIQNSQHSPGFCQMAERLGHSYPPKLSACRYSVGSIVTCLYTKHQPEAHTPLCSSFSLLPATRRVLFSRDHFDRTSLRMLSLWQAEGQDAIFVARLGLVRIDRSR